MSKKILIYLIFAGLCFLAYANSLNNAFVSDDITAILENPRLAYISDFWLDPSALLNSLIYKIAKFNVLPYHLASVILHFVNTILVFWFLRLFFKAWPSFLSALIFAAHPIHTEAVTWISGRPYPVLAFFALIIYLLYYKATHYENKKFSFITYLASLAIFAYFIIKNFSFCAFLPFFIVSSDIIFGRAKKNWKLWVPFFLILALRLSLATQVIHQRAIFTLLYKAGASEMWRNPVFPFIYSIFLHLWLLAWPVKLTFFHEPVVFYPLAMWSGFMALIVFISFLPYIFKKAKVIFLGILMYALFLAPTYSPIPLTSVVAERYAYLPSIFLSILFAFFYEKYLQRLAERNRPIATLLFISLIAAYGVRTIIRNADWKDEKRLWKATLSAAPYSPWAHNSMGSVYLQEGNINKAIDEFNLALKINPDLAEAYNNRGRAYQDSGDINQAILDYTRAININPDFVEAYNNRGIAYKKKNEFDKAISDYNRALKLNPNLAEVYYNRGNAWQKKGDFNQAILDYNKAIEINPHSAQFYTNRAAAYFLMGKQTKAKEALK